uniref:Uncharacterized protein n=1 Tax=Piliocolobus tephrosceles TaxID=591936 RepID=A0A8C9H4H0_9PRIM
MLISIQENSFVVLYMDWGKWLCFTFPFYSRSSSKLPIYITCNENFGGGKNY